MFLTSRLFNAFSIYFRFALKGTLPEAASLFSLTRLPAASGVYLADAGAGTVPACDAAEVINADT